MNIFVADSENQQTSISLTILKHYTIRSVTLRSRGKWKFFLLYCIYMLNLGYQGLSNVYLRVLIF